jgi:hypothetical protein
MVCTPELWTLREVIFVSSDLTPEKRRRTLLLYCWFVNLPAAS